MRLNILSLLIVVWAVVFALQPRQLEEPDLRGRLDETGMYLAVAGLSSEGELGFRRAVLDDGERRFTGSWNFCIATADYPPSYSKSVTLVFQRDGTVVQETVVRTKIAGSDWTNVEYRSDVSRKSGVWLRQGEEVLIDFTTFR